MILDWLGVVCTLTLVNFGASFDDPDYNSSDYHDYYSTPGQIEPLTIGLPKYRNAMDVLFGSVAEASAKVYDPLTDNRDYWTLDNVWHTIHKQNIGVTNLQPEQKKDVQGMLALINQQMQTVASAEAYPEIFAIFNASRFPFDCALGRKETNRFLRSIAISSQFSYKCDTTMVPLWRALVKTDFSGKSCTLNGVVRAVVELHHAIQSAVTQQPLNDTSLQSIISIKVELLQTLAHHYSFLNRIICGNQPGVQYCDELDNMLCVELGSTQILHVTNLIEAGSKRSPPTSSAEMFGLLDVQQHLASISHSFTKYNVERNAAVASVFARDMLDRYMGIVDNTIGSSSVSAWKQTPERTSQNELTNVLVQCEQYVEQASEVILDRQSKTDQINKTTLTIKMGRYSANEGGQRTVHLEFDGAQITANPFNTTEGNSSVYVYALHYKSWRETLQAINGNATVDNGNATGRMRSAPRFFVGKGGVISLSTKTNQKKQSVPVTYKMNFADDVSFTDGDSVARRCLSCEYLDVDSKLWISNGCYVTGADNNGVTCHCNHTTNFAAFMSPYTPQYETTEQQAAWLDFMEYAGSMLSVVGLLASFIAFCLVREGARNDRLRAHINLVIALLFVHIIQLGSDFAVFSNSLCVVTTLVTHYFLLAAFMWMLVEGFFLYLYVVQVFVHSTMEKRWWMYTIGWCIPFVIVAISAGYGLSTDNYIQKLPPKNTSNPCEEGQMLYPPFEVDPSERKYASCWLDAESGMTWSFIAPAMAVILCNLVILCMVVQVLLKLSERSKGMKPYQAQSQRGSHSNHAYYSPSVPSKTGRPSTQIPAGKSPVLEYKAASKDHFSSTDTDDTILHGNSISNSSRPSPRSASQVHFHPRVTERPRVISTSNGSDSNFLADARTAAKGAMVLLPVLGIPWICGMLGYKSFVLTVIFVLFNSVQGVAIFLVYCVFNQEVRRGMQRHLQLYRLNHKHGSRSRTSSTSSLRNAFNLGLLSSWRRRSTAVSTLSNHA